MKKIFAIIMAVCLMASLLCVTAFAAEAPASDVVLRVSALKTDGTTVLVDDYTSFEDGWNAAMELAINSKEMKQNDYARVIVDIYADWNAVDGEFTKAFWNGKGFNWDTIYFQPNVRMTLNLNGHTINRGLTEWEYNGEVMYVDENADVIINDGTITGGWSCNGAGGIHINDNANVTLNNVNVVGNTAEDDDGSAIAAYDGATLIMNGGSISNNTLWRSFKSYETPCGGLYLNDSIAYLNNVVFEGNIFRGYDYAYGVAVYVDDGELTMENCTFKGNGYKNSSNNIWTPQSVVYIDEGSMTLNNCVFEDNGTKGLLAGPNMISIFDGTVKISNSIFRNNSSARVIFCNSGTLEVTESHFEGNTANVFNGAANEGSYFKDCSFANNSEEKYYTFAFGEDNKLSFENCEFDADTVFNDKSRATFVGNAPKGKSLNAGSIFGEGSLAMVISLLALIASGASIFMIADLKKKLVPVAANNAEKTEDEE